MELRLFCQTERLRWLLILTADVSTDFCTSQEFLRDAGMELMKGWRRNIESSIKTLLSMKRKLPRSFVLILRWKLSGVPNLPDPT
jgi:hypothetical protein